jgi:hypothetical protein
MRNEAAAIYVLGRRAIRSGVPGLVLVHPQPFSIGALSVRGANAPWRDIPGHDDGSVPGLEGRTASMGLMVPVRWRCGPSGLACSGVPARNPPGQLTLTTQANYR